MSFQLLISTIDQQNYDLLDKMKVRSDAVVINQCGVDKVEEFDYKGYKIKWVCMSKRGVGLSRNTALSHATADIVLFSDDDMVYNENYKEEVEKAFVNNSNADIICFNIELINSIKNFGYRNNKSNKKLNLFNSMRYGACRIAVRRKVVLKNRISFSLLFGGGAEFSSGEDSLFIRDCYNKKMKLYANTYTLGQVDDSSSTWFCGVNDKLFIDKGMLLYNAFPFLYGVLYIYYAFKMKKMDKNYSFSKILKLFKKGKKLMKEYR
jgi:glycosyltransferase involved in cell wall biosynthesis